MVHPLRTQFVIADAGHARWVVRSEAAESDFVTVDQRQAPLKPRRSPQGAAFDSSGQRYNIEERSDAAREHRFRFAHEVADAINAQAAGGGLNRLVIVAPARMLSAIRRDLSPQARAKLAGSLAKDLCKTPDHELKGWLQALERG